jgi:hypothetical protein
MYNAYSHSGTLVLCISMFRLGLHKILRQTLQALPSMPEHLHILAEREAGIVFADAAVFLTVELCAPG